MGSRTCHHPLLPQTTATATATATATDRRRQQQAWGGFAEFRAICRIACWLLFGTNVAHDERLHTTQDLGESRN